MSSLSSACEILLLAGEDLFFLAEVPMQALLLDADAVEGAFGS